MSMDINIIKKKILNLINASMNIRRKTYCEPPEWRHLLCEH